MQRLRDSRALTVRVHAEVVVVDVGVVDVAVHVHGIEDLWVALVAAEPPHLGGQRIYHTARRSKKKRVFQAKPEQVYLALTRSDGARFHPSGDTVLLWGGRVNYRRHTRECPESLAGGLAGSDGGTVYGKRAPCNAAIER